MVPLLGSREKGLIFVLSAPAGTGKTTLAHMITTEFACVVESISYTTRRPRRGELDGKDYYFISRELFEKKISRGEFLEYAEVFGHYYGTSKTQVRELTEQGKHVILVIDTQGALQLMSDLEAVFIFLKPPNLQELQKRLLSRKSESFQAIQDRLSWAEKELALAEKYDYQIVNQNLETAYKILVSVLIAEEHRTR